MLFNSFIFLGLVLITMLVYYISNLARYQIAILIIASLVFYSWHNIALLSLLISSVAINVICSFVIANHKVGNRKLVAWIGVCTNLGILAFFKYAGLISLTLFDESGSVGEFLLDVPLPIGISFFTFQGISLLVDVYKENHYSNEKIIPKSLLEHAKKTLFFIAFFPQLVAGPIVKAHEFLPQIRIKSLREVDWEQCFKEIIFGYFLKMVIADNLKDYTFWIEFPYFQGRDTVSLITLLFGFSCQIFADFAGYSLIAIGIARLFGYNLNANFNAPYLSTSFREFWKRWHISLSSFLQEYLYIPLGGNKKGKYRTYINLMITMVLGGLWHGAAWSYAIWGAFHGVALATERFMSHRITFKSNIIVKGLQMVCVFSMVTVAWLLFKLPEFTHVLGYFESILGNIEMKVDFRYVANILLFSSPIVLYHLYVLFRSNFENNVITSKYEFVIYGLMLFLIVTNSGIAGDFIYFQF